MPVVHFYKLFVRLLLRDILMTAASDTDILDIQGRCLLSLFRPNFRIRTLVELSGAIMFCLS